ncbi:MAG: 50S ribosomal protein L29 [Nitrosomonas sp.]|jgi:large subunit ribosomal protein L29|nr:50S ribosomal protein L29 [Nitrosomonas sp.]MCP5250630.1 50S ribosomal protein L29 [Burkholderiales bacterium]MCW5584444.1 50S ribosomal protein L29 [Gammaproteobacteria bacterium]MCP5291144.1 50S ribosomal protein L29 [Burkholderiales bacterium]MDR4519749.1 50S ribosomal protein L29 [Nitrosomonas sp.]
MNVKELRNMTLVDLNKELQELLKIQFSIRMQLATQQTTNTNQLSRNRRNIARVKTLITEKSTV